MKRVTKTKQQLAVELVQKELSVLSSMKQTSKSVLETLQLNSLKQSIIGVTAPKKQSSPQKQANQTPLPALPAEIQPPVVSVITPGPTTINVFPKTKQALKQHQPQPRVSTRQSMSPQRVPSRNSNKSPVLLGPTARVTRHKPPHDFVTTTRSSLTALATTSSTGLTSRNKTKDAATTRQKLQESDARLVEATGRMEAEKLRLQELVLQERIKKEKRLQKLKEKRRLANQAAIASWSLDQTGDPNQDALNEEGVSLDYALDDFLASVTNQNLDISAQSPPRGMSALYKVSRSPSPVRSVPRKQEDEDEDGILKLYGSSSYTAPTTGKPTPWKLQTDQQITIFDIAPQTANRLTDTTISENIQPDHQLNHAGDEALDQNDEEAIIIQHVTHPSRGTSPQPPFNTQDAEMQTTISQPTRITVPSRLATSIRKGRERFNRIKSLGYLGNPEFEPIDAIQLMADELLDDMLHFVAAEVQTLSDDFVSQIIATEFLDHV